MSVWLTIPSARPADEVTRTMSIWRSMGYRIALQRDPGADEPGCVDKIITVPYDGYSRACNRVVAAVIEADPSAEWFICAGDDTLPDPKLRAEVIALQCREHFYEIAAHQSVFDASEPELSIRQWAQRRETFGVMQPTGDRWGDDERSRKTFGADRGAYIDRVAGSAWIGREFVERTYGGKGPMHPEYFHMFNDEELQLVAEQLGVFWQRRDLIHLHNHCKRHAVPGTKVPGFLERAYSRTNWDAMAAIFKQRKAAGFPGAFEGKAE